MSHSTPQFKCLALLAAAIVPLTLMTGCANMVATDNHSATPAATVAGSVHGGQQAVSDATINLYAAGANGYGSLPTLFATTTSSTDGHGSFVFSQLGVDPVNFPTGIHDTTSNVYSCPSTGDPQMYIVAKDGSTAGPSTPINTAAAFIIALGPCSGAGSAYVTMDEATTVATLAALQQFFNPATEGFGYNTTAQSALGFANGVATISTLANPAGGGAGANTTVTPASSVAGVTVTATPETAKINTIANILAACVNTSSQSGNVSANCQTLFDNAVPPASSNVTSQPGTTYLSAVDTLQAGYYMLVNPTDGGATALNNLFTLGGSGIVPFQPVLSAAPTDWTIGVTYSSSTNCAGGSNFLQYGYQIGIDANGNVWTANGNATTSGLSEIGPSGSPMACSDIAYNKLRGGAVIDTAGNVWATSDATNVVYKFNGTTTTTIPVSGATFTYGIAADGKGNVFFTDPSGLKLYELPSSATATTVPTLIGPVATSSPYQIAVDSKGTVVVAQSGASGTTITAYPTTTVGGSTYPAAGTALTNAAAYVGAYGLAFDSNGGFWVGNSAGKSGAPGDFTDYTPVTYSSTTAGDPNTVVFGTPINTTAISAGGLSTARQTAVDGAGNVWFPNNSAASSGLFAVTELSSAGVALSPTAGTAGAATQNGGFQKAATVFASPRGLAIDPSGNVWVTNTASTFPNWITEIVGAAVPVVTPLSAAAANNTFGTKP
ncbi:MAG TPA: hypothetical protein VIJ79_10600 [Acidobacteriaceae bacterium]